MLYCFLGEHAQKLYFNLKKRFHKRRNFLKRLQKSGNNNQILLKKARSDVNVYAFLDWLIPFTQVRQPRVPIKPEEANLLEAKYLASVECDELADSRPSFVDLHSSNYEQEGGGYQNHNSSHHNQHDEEYQNSQTQHREFAVKEEEHTIEDDHVYNDEEEIVTVRPSSPQAISESVSTALYPHHHIPQRHLNHSPPQSPQAERSPSSTNYRIGSAHYNYIQNSTASPCKISNTLKKMASGENTNSCNGIGNNLNNTTIDHSRQKHNNHYHRQHHNTASLGTEPTGRPSKKRSYLESSMNDREINDHHNTSSASCTTNNNASLMQNVDLENEDHLFGLMVGAELKRLPYKERSMAKLKIQNILFDMQMTVFKKGQGVVEKRENHTV